MPVNRGAKGVRSLIDIAARLEQAFIWHRDRPALCIDGKRYSYGDLHRRAAAIQAHIDASVDQPLIGVAANDSLDTYASILAVLCAGRAFVPINPAHPTQRNAGILAQAGVSTLLVPDAALMPQLGALTDVAPVLTTDMPAGRAPTIVACASSELAYLLFTSGSTGEPKGVPITRGNLSAFLDSLDASGHGATAADRVLQMFDPTFDFSIASYLAPLSKGACVYTVPATQAKFTEVYRLLAEERLTVAPLVPSLLGFLRPYFEDIHLPDLRLTALCGEALFSDIADEWSKCAPQSRIANFYGPTEATVFAMVYAAAGGKSHNGVVSIGRTMPLNTAIIVDECLQPVGAGKKGELCLAGPQVTPGYWRDELRNADAFFERTMAGDNQRFYRTGDIVMADADGDHYFCGRIGTQIKLQGFRVELGEIEYQARAAARGCECVVVPRLDKSGCTELNLFVENYPGDPKSVLASLRARVPPYMVPKRVLWIERLPMNSNGKIDRTTLKRSVDAHCG
jgi:amino acid adenylation domain-containing protein